jgi:hypothetical protein
MHIAEIPVNPHVLHVVRQCVILATHVAIIIHPLVTVARYLVVAIAGSTIAANLPAALKNAGMTIAANVIARKFATKTNFACDLSSPLLVAV